MHVEIWSDIACPWCYVGKRRFEAALERFAHRDAVRVTWRSFELDPGAPAERTGSGAEHLAAKYGMSVEQAQAMNDRMTEVAASEGLDFHLERQRGGNTFDGHRVLHLAAERGLQDAVKERIMRAYFSEGALVSDHETLVRLAGEAGLDPDEVRAVLSGDAYSAEVRDDERAAASLGISAVPFFVVDRALGASGAQSPDVLLQLLEQGWANRSPLAVVAGGDACGIDGC